MAAIIAYYFYKVKPSSLILGAFLIPSIMAPLSSALAFYLSFTADVKGFVNMILKALNLQVIPFLQISWVAYFILCLASIWRWLPLITLYLYTRMSLIPQEILEQSEIDGAGDFYRFSKIIIPISFPSLVFSVFLLTVMLNIFSLEDLHGITMGGPGHATTLLAFYGSMKGINSPMIAYALTISFFPTFINFALLIILLKLMREM